MPHLFIDFSISRKGAALSYNQVIEIFKLKDRSSGPRLVAPIARKYGVTPKAIRNIWNHTTWADLTTAPHAEAAAINDRRTQPSSIQLSTSQDHLPSNGAQSPTHRGTHSSPSLPASEQERGEAPACAQTLSAAGGAGGRIGANANSEVRVPGSVSPSRICQRRGRTRAKPAHARARLHGRELCAASTACVPASSLARPLRPRAPPLPRPSRRPSRAHEES